MLDSNPTEKIELNQCHLCAAELLDRDKFCRRCGTNLKDRIDSISGEIRTESSSSSDTVRISAGGILNRSFSAPMVKVVTQELSERTSSLRASRWAMRLVMALIAIPLWMMIVLLSPLDAYAAAKTFTKQV